MCVCLIVFIPPHGLSKLKKPASMITISKIQENLGVWSFNLQKKNTDSDFVLNKDTSATRQNT